MTPPPKKLCKKNSRRNGKKIGQIIFILNWYFTFLTRFSPYKVQIILTKLSNLSKSHARRQWCVLDLRKSLWIICWLMWQFFIERFAKTMWDFWQGSSLIISRWYNWLMVYIKNIPIPASYFATFYLIRYILYFQNFQKKSKKYLRIWGIYLNYCPGDIVT